VRILASGEGGSGIGGGAGKSLDVKPAYLKGLREIVDLEVICKPNRTFVLIRWGGGAGYSDTLLRHAGVKVATVHDDRDVLFGGHAPQPDDHLVRGEGTL
jgi:phosphoglucomutase